MMTAEQILKLNVFESHSYGDLGIRRWASARDNVNSNFGLHKATIMESYHMAIEYLLKSIVSNSDCYARDHILSHNVLALAKDIRYLNRNRYYDVLRMFSDYYREGRYEKENKEVYQTIMDYFDDITVYDRVDDLLCELCSLAMDTLHSRKFRDTNVKGINLPDDSGGT